MADIEDYEIEEFEEAVGKDEPKPIEHDEGRTYVAEPVPKVEEPVIEPVEEVVVQPLESKETIEEPPKAEVVEPIVVETPRPREVPLYEVQGISDGDKRMILEARISEVIQRSQIPYIPALGRYRQSPTSPPLLAVLKVDHKCVQEAWDYYKVNVPNPTVEEFFDIVRKFTRTPEDIIPRIVEINFN